MSYIPTKKLLIGGLAAIMLALQVPVTALAATEQEIADATEAGIAYLASTQADNGSIPGIFGGETDWAVIAIEASGGDASTFKNGNDASASAVDFIKTDAPSDATDVARRILAVASTQGDSTDFGGTDYNALLATYYTGGQFGDAAALNDDAFGIMAIGATGDESLYAMAQASLDHLLANQGSDGSFTGGTPDCAWCTPNSNDTASAVIAMGVASAIGLSYDELYTAQSKALTYLLSLQQDDGGFIYAPAYGGPSDGSSTTWALMALNAFGTGVEAPAMAARDWLLANQNDDGGFSWMGGASDPVITADAVVALLGTAWLLNIDPIAAPEEEEEEEEEEAPVPVITTKPQPTKPKPTTTPAPTNDDTTRILAVATSTETESEPTETAPVEDGQENEGEQAVTVAKTGNSATKYIVYAVIALSLIGFGWLLFQPKKV